MAYCTNGYGSYYYCNSGWYNWGRWVLLGVVVVAFFLIALLFSCISARRRRKRGQMPFRGTGWATAGPFNPQQNNYNPNYPMQPQQEYNYNQQPQGGYYGQNQGYFGGQQTGVEVPNKTYQPPSGPPPGKNY